MVFSAIPRSRMVFYGVVVIAGLMVWWNVRTPKPRTALAGASLPQLSGASGEAVERVFPGVRVPLLPAERDPFVVAAPPPPPAPVQAPRPIPEPAPLVTVPAPNLVFQGQMTAPDGQRLVFVSLNDVAVQLKEGMTLSTGHVVKSISTQAVELVYPPTNTTTRLEIPAAPSYEVR